MQTTRGVRRAARRTKTIRACGGPPARPLAEALEPRAYFAGGGLDPAFGAGGTTVTTFGPGGVSLQAVEVLPDSRVVILGLLTNDAGATVDGFVARLRADGSADPTFGGGDGRVELPAATGRRYAGLATAADGSVALAGFSFDTANPLGGTQIVATRLDAAGQPVAAFGPDGSATLDVPNLTFDQATGVALQPDGKVVVAGIGIGLNTGGGTPTGDSVVARYLTTGQLDPAFGAGGLVDIDADAPNDPVGGVALQPDGRILVAGFNRLVRLTPGGARDPAFASAGVLTHAMGAATIQGLTPDGRIHIGTIEPESVPGPDGQPINVPTGDALIGRYTAAGAPDGGTNGVITLAVNQVFDRRGLGGTDDGVFGIDVRPLPDGKYLGLGGVRGPAGTAESDLALARFNADGSVDATFGTNGRALANPSVADAPVRLALAPGDKAVAAGFTSTDPADPTATRSAFARFLLDDQAPGGNNGGGPEGVTVTLSGGSLPTSVVGGARSKAAVTLTLRNDSDTLVSGGSVALFASTDGTLDDGDARMLEAGRRIVVKPGASKSVAVRIPSFPSLPDGAYRILARVDLGGDTTVVADPGTLPAVTIAAPHVDLRGTFEASAPATLTRGGRATARLRVENLGNVTARQTISVALRAAAPASPAAGGPVLATVPVRVNLKPGAARSFNLKFVPSDAASPGVYALAADIDAGNALEERDETNNVATAARTFELV